MPHVIFEQFIESGCAKIRRYAIRSKTVADYAVVPIEQITSPALSTMCTTYCNTPVCRLSRDDRHYRSLRTGFRHYGSGIPSKRRTAIRSRSSSAVSFEPLSALKINHTRVRRRDGKVAQANSRAPRAGKARQAACCTDYRCWNARLQTVTQNITPLR